MSTILTLFVGLPQSVPDAFISANFVKWVHFNVNVNVSGETASPDSSTSTAVNENFKNPNSSQILFILHSRLNVFIFLPVQTLPLPGLGVKSELYIGQLFFYFSFTNKLLCNSQKSQIQLLDPLLVLKSLYWLNVENCRNRKRERFQGSCLKRWFLFHFILRRHLSENFSDRIHSPSFSTALTPLLRLDRHGCDLFHFLHYLQLRTLKIC